MRKAVIHALAEMATTDDRIVLLTGDLGFMVIEEFADRHPARFINVGVAEANMAGLAAGLALEGMRPYCYSIATFATLRPFEQLRNGAHLHDLAVRVIGVGGGFGYGTAGITHHAVEDIAVMRALPRMRIVAPADDRDAAGAIRALHDAAGPTYYRLAKDARVLEALPDGFETDRLTTVGVSQVTLLAIGTIADEALRARQLLEERGLEIRVAVATSIAPFPVASLLDIIDSSSILVTLEDHVLAGGLGSLVAEVMADHGRSVPLVRLGVTETGHATLGSERFLRSRAGLDAASVARLVSEAAPLQLATVAW
jgi:transketolase